MADIKFLSGIITNVSTVSSTTGSSYRGTGSVRTFHTSMFRIDNKPVKFAGVLNLCKGDEVKVAGFNKKGEFQATVVKNITTGIGHSDKTIRFGFVYILIGQLIGVFVITIPITIFMTIWGVIHITQAIRNNTLLKVM